MKTGERAVGCGGRRACREGEPAAQADGRHYAAMCAGEREGGAGDRDFQSNPEWQRIGEEREESYSLHPLSCFWR